MNLLKSIREGLALFGKYAESAKVDYVPNSFFNGTPNHPSEVYFCIEAPDFPKEWEKELFNLGWVEEWPFYWISDVTIGATKYHKQKKIEKVTEKIISDLKNKVSG